MEMVDRENESLSRENVVKTVVLKESVFGQDASYKTHRFKNEFFPYNSNCLGIVPLMTERLVLFSTLQI